MNTLPPIKMMVFPNLGAVGASTTLSAVIGALLMITLVGAVLIIIICAITWAISTASGNTHGAAKARMGLFVALGVAVLTGAGVAWMNFLLAIGQTL